MGCVRCKSSDTSDNALMGYVEEDNKAGILEAWAEIATPGSLVAGGESWKKLEKKKSHVLLEGYVETLDNQYDLTRSKSLTDDDLEDLKGCLDLGFGFSYDEIPVLCNTLPALELCYSMSQRFSDDKQNNNNNNNRSPDSSSLDDSPSPPIANWKISSPGDNPDDVKARLKYWAQAVACTVQLCS